MNQAKNQQGVVLILALVMTMVLLGVSTVLATTAIREARVAGSVGQGLTAFYDSESAVEATIYEISKLGTEPATLDGSSGASPSGGDWEREVMTEADEFIIDFLPSGALRSIDLYNRDNGNAAAGVSGLTLNWSTGSELRVELYEWDGGTLSGPNSNTYTCTTPPCSASVVLNPGLAYQADFIAAGTSVSDLFVSTSPAGTLVDLPTTVVVTSDFLGTKQAVELTLPVPPPWSAPSAVCGDGDIEGTEQCDDGNTDDGDGCSAVCEFENSCGNSILEDGEDCDDGNTDDGDGCSSLCQLEGAVCGNGTVELSEECDEGANNGNVCTPAYGLSCTYCNSSCLYEDVIGGSCGNGTVEGSEQCDDGAANGTVCAAPYNSSCSYCTNSCLLQDIQGPYCGDGSINGSEQCDGSSLGGATCTSLGFDGGSLSCNSSCSVNTGGCCYQALRSCTAYADCSDLSGHTCMTGYCTSISLPKFIRYRGLFYYNRGAYYPNRYTNSSNNVVTYNPDLLVPYSGGSGWIGYTRNVSGYPGIHDWLINFQTIYIGCKGPTQPFPQYRFVTEQGNTYQFSADCSSIWSNTSTYGTVNININSTHKSILNEQIKSIEVRNFGQLYTTDTAPSFTVAVENWYKATSNACGPV